MSKDSGGKAINMGHVCNSTRSPPGLAYSSAKTLANCCNKLSKLARTAGTSTGLDTVLVLMLPQKQAQVTDLSLTGVIWSNPNVKIL